MKPSRRTLFQLFAVAAAAVTIPFKRYESNAVPAVTPECDCCVEPDYVANMVVTFPPASPLDGFFVKHGDEIAVFDGDELVACGDGRVLGNIISREPGSVCVEMLS